LRVQPWASTRRDPYAFLAALERERVTDVLIDSLACVLPGADEIMRGSISPTRRRKRTCAVERIDAPERTGASHPHLRRRPLHAFGSAVDHAGPKIVRRTTRVLLGRERCGYVIPSA
jgi:hypothetical protein